MSEQGNRMADSRASGWSEAGDRFADPDIFAPCPAPSRANDDANGSIARLLNGPLTALLIYMEELKQHSHLLCDNKKERDHLQKIVENALQQTERVCALVKQVQGVQGGASPPARQGRDEHAKEGQTAALVQFSADGGRKPLTRREREVLNLISEGCSNKQGALRMRISPRTFESHRAEAMRKLGARNTADLVRAALLQAMD
jgi:DNA-binding CsgD family transcriptional regulator